MWLVMLSVNLRIRFDALTNFGVFFPHFFQTMRGSSNGPVVDAELPEN